MVFDIGSIILTYYSGIGKYVQKDLPPSIHGFAKQYIGVRSMTYSASWSTEQYPFIHLAKPKGKKEMKLSFHGFSRFCSSKVIFVVVALIMHISATFKETGQPWRDYRLMDGPALSWEALEQQFSLYFFLLLYCRQKTPPCPSLFRGRSRRRSIRVPGVFAWLYSTVEENH